MAGTTFAQERAEKNVSVDCGKGNTFHKVHGFVGCFISHSDDFQGVIDHIIDDDLFKLHLPIASTCREHACSSFEGMDWKTRQYSTVSVLRTMCLTTISTISGCGGISMEA